MAADDIEAAFRGAFGAFLRHQTGGVRRGGQRDVEHLRRRRHFKIQRPGNAGLQSRHIGVGDMATVLTQMRGDPVRASLNRLQRGA